jgi:hypothetical protein
MRRTISGDCILQVMFHLKGYFNFEQKCLLNIKLPFTQQLERY